MNRPFGLPGTGPIPRYERQEAAGWLPRGYIDGLILSNDTTDATNDIGIAAGVCRSQSNIGRDGVRSTLHRDQMDLELPIAIIKQLDVSWAPGNYDPEGYSGGGRSGGRATAAIANALYHAFVIGGSGLRPDVLFDESVTINGSARLPFGYTAWRRIGAIIRSGAAIKTFTQIGDAFRLAVPTPDVAVANLGTTATNYTLTVPDGGRVTALFMATMSHLAGGTAVLIASPDDADDAPSLSAGYASLANEVAGQYQAGHFAIGTNTLGQIRARSTAADTALGIVTRGWIDPRGRDA